MCKINYYYCFIIIIFVQLFKMVYKAFFDVIYMERLRIYDVLAEKK